MSRFRLRYRDTNLELPQGEFAIGRSSKCNLALADALVSRRHAVFHVTANKVFLEDTGSRNGIIVNGAVSPKKCRLTHMDRIYIGSQELVLVDGAKVTDQLETAPSVFCAACGAVNGKAQRRCKSCGHRLDSVASQTFQEPRRTFSGSHLFEEDSEVTRTETTRDVIDGIAAKALDLGRYEEAERILTPHLDRLLERALRGLPLSSSEGSDTATLLANATANALNLARSLRSEKWIDWVFRIYSALGRLMPMETIESLHEVVRALGYHKRKYVRTYLQLVKNKAAEWGPSERFRVQRLEGLTEMIIAGR